MACLMCGSLTKRSSIGNLTCSKCGLIQVSRIPLLGGGIGSADRKLVEMNLLCAEMDYRMLRRPKKSCAQRMCKLVEEITPMKS